MKNLIRLSLALSFTLALSSCSKTGNADMMSTQPDYRNSAYKPKGGMGTGTGKDYANGIRADQDTRSRPAPSPNSPRVPAQESQKVDHSQVLKE